MKDYSLYDNKTIIIEKLNEPTTYDPSKILIYVRYLDANKFELSEPKEVFVLKEKTTIHEVGQEASKVFNLPVNRLFLIICVNCLF